jgi:hypothetical protein
MDGDENELVDVVYREIGRRRVGERGDVGEDVLPNGSGGELDVERPDRTDRGDNATLKIGW